MTINNYLTPISSFHEIRGKILDACYKEDIESLKYFSKFYNLNAVTNEKQHPLLHFVIFFDKPKSFDALINLGMKVDIKSPIDGGSPLRFAALLNKPECVNKLIALGADVNVRDNSGKTPLLTALVAENYVVAELLLDNSQVDVNIPNHFFYVSLQVAYESNLSDISEKIVKHPTFDATFHKLFSAPTQSYDYIDMLKNLDITDESILTAYYFAKEFGHKFDFESCIPFTNVNYHQSECFSFEGLSNRISINAFSSSLTHFYEDIVTSSEIPSWAKMAFNTVNESFNFSAENLFNPAAFYNKIKLGDIVVVPSGWHTEIGAHSITFVFHNNMLYCCNRGEESDGIHGITEFLITKPMNITENLIKTMLSASDAPQAMQQDMIDMLGLEKIGEIENPVQLVGNCSWASLEAAFEASLLASFLEQGIDNHSAHTLSKKSFTAWEEYDLSTTLLEAIAKQELLSKHGIYDDLLIKTIDVHHDAENPYYVQRGAVILNELRHPDVFMKFNEDIGKYLIKYYPSSYNISYMGSYEPSLLQKIANYFVTPTPLNEELEPLVKAYYDFIKACDAYQNQMKTSNINLNDVLDYSNQHLLDDLFNQPATINASTYELNVTAQSPLLPLMPLYYENGVELFV